MNRRRFLAASAVSSAYLAVRENSLLALPEDRDARTAGGDALPENLRKKLMGDPYRPQFHLLPKANWMNDPCAPRFHEGEYHMFFQYNPGGPVWGDMHWAHAVSADMMHWRHLPGALAPSVGSYDAFGCFTGSVLPGMETPTILYTGVTRSPHEMETIRGEGLREVQCIATATDPQLLRWRKGAKPVLDSPPAGLKVTGFRDPCPWKDGDSWYLIVGSGFEKVGGAVLLYSSADGRKWEYLHPLAQGKWNEGSQVNPVDTGEMWECPDFFPLGDKHVLLYSTERKVYWEVGSFDRKELKFHAERRGLLDRGYYYAMKSMVDAKGRRILWGWVEESRTEAECKGSGWAGSMALPRVLTLSAEGGLRMAVPEEFGTLRKATETVARPANAEELNARLKGMGIRDRAGELSCRFRVDRGPVALELKGKDGGLLAGVRYAGDVHKAAVEIAGKELPLAPDGHGVSTLRLWMDGSVIEAFLDEHEAMTARCFVGGDGEIAVGWRGAPEALVELGVSSVAAISKDRLTS